MINTSIKKVSIYGAVRFYAAVLVRAKRVPLTRGVAARPRAWKMKEPSDERKGICGWKK